MKFSDMARESYAEEAAPVCAPCRLSVAEVRASRQRLLPELVAAADVVSGLTRHTTAGLRTGLRLKYKYHEGLLTMLARLTEAEQAACSDLKVNLSLLPCGGIITLELTGPAGTREKLLRLSKGS